MGDPAKFWDVFYQNNSSNFFKDRKWLHQEFPILDDATSAGAGPMTLLEIGAGAGNTAFPILAKNQNPQLKLHACDFSKAAVDVMRNHEQYNPKYIQADVWDVAGDELPLGLGEASVDVVLMVFIFSALAPSQWQKAVANVYRLLKPGGHVCFRDYGRGDLAQVRFRKGRYLEENFYVRGDGTRVYFFEQDELAEIWKKPVLSSPVVEGQTNDAAGELFEIEQLGVDRRLIVNRARKLKMYRCWLQGRFRKK
jgi:tRNAThr (cytosine32-N3)-methyltransferase